jgi:RsiW-degrading membrane proteinase PrsW (M82 family)
MTGTAATPPAPASPMPGSPSAPPAPASAAPPPVRPTDWTEQVSIFQPRQAAFWLFSILLLIGGASFIDEQLTFADASMTAWLVGLVLLAVYAVPVYLLVNTLDLFEREPRSLLIGALLWGAIVATYLAGHINDQWASILQKLFGAEFTRQWGAALIGPGVEELLKFLGVVVIYLIARAEFDDVLDGFVYGAMVGLGFTLEEDMYYFFTHFVGQAGASDLGGLFEGFFTRIIVGGPYSHVLLTGLTGMGLAWYVTRPDIARGRRLLAAVLLYAAGVAAHFVWNSPLLEGILGNDPGPTDWIAWAAVKGLPFLILLGVLVRVAMWREQRWVRDALAEDVAAGVLTKAEIDTLESLRARRAARKAVGARLGVAGERLMTRLQHAQIALAVASTGTEPERDTRIATDRELIANLRAQLAALTPIGGPAAAGARAAVGVAASGVAGSVPATAASATFAPTHRAPAEGLASWPTPDPSGQGTQLAGGLPLEIIGTAADWAHVRASNGWTGWVDGRRLVAEALPT